MTGRYVVFHAQRFYRRGQAGVARWVANLSDATEFVNIETAQEIAARHHPSIVQQSIRASGELSLFLASGLIESGDCPLPALAINGDVETNNK